MFEIEVEEIGPSLKFATAKVNRVSRSGGGGYSGGGQAAPSGPAGATPAEDPWASPAPASTGAAAPAPGNDPWGAPGVAPDEPPF